MKIHTRLVFDMNTGVVLEAESYEYDGPVTLCCGATSAQTNLQSQQQTVFSSMQNQAQQVFGNSSTVFNDLMNTFSPTVAAGPDQEGMSAGEKANLDSQAVTSTGAAYRNASQAVGEAEAAQGGGNDSQVTGGSKTGTDLGVATSAASQESSELNQINEQDYAIGRENYNNATKGLEEATGAFNPVSSIDNSTTTAGSALGTTDDQISKENNSWVSAVTGALGNIAGDVVTGGMSNLGKGLGFFGGNGPSQGDN